MKRIPSLNIDICFLYAILFYPVVFFLNFTKYLNVVGIHKDMEFSGKEISDSMTPKYKQVEGMIIGDIETGVYREGDRIPSINETSEDLLVSRDTVEKAYANLKKRGIISSVCGKGFFVTDTQVGSKPKICLLFNKLSTYKHSIYYSFLKKIGENAIVDLFIYNYNIKLFESIVSNNVKRYDYFVILPYSGTDEKSIGEIIKTIPRGKVILIDYKMNCLGNDYPLIYQDHQQDIMDAMQVGSKRILSYKKIYLIYPQKKFYPEDIIRGFKAFCKKTGIDHEVIATVDPKVIGKDQAYIVINDEDLVAFLKLCRSRKLKLGKDVGLISYNDSPFKEILEDGITTISTNHSKIGEIAADIVLKSAPMRYQIPCRFTLRNSL